MKQSLLTKITKLLLLSTILLSSCGEVDVSEQIRNYVENFDVYYCMDNICSGHFKETYEECDANNIVYRSHRYECEFSKIDAENFTIHATLSFEGQIEEGEVSRTIDIYKKDDTYHLDIYFPISTNSTYKNVSLDDAKTYYQTIFYSNFEAYPRGGLYYGDYFITQLSNFKNIITINDDNNIGFNYYDDDRVEGYIMSQEILLDCKGMLLHSMSKIKNCSTNSVGTVTQDVSYTYLNEV